MLKLVNFFAKVFLDVIYVIIFFDFFTRQKHIKLY
jgi:hypothetical protein